MNGEIISELVDVDVAHEDAPEAILVHRVNWRVARGELWAVGGDLASGKTSLLATAAGLNRPASGTLRIFGRDLREATEAEQVEWRKRIGFVFEHTGRLLSHLTAVENVALPLQYHLDMEETQARAQAAELLAQAGLSGYADAWPSRLRPRVQQRVSLVRALALPTDALFLDNPLSGLAPSGARWWLNFLRELRMRQAAEGKPVTIVATCDDFSGWLDVATHFAVIEAQRLRVLTGRDAAAHELAAGRESATTVH